MKPGLVLRLAREVARNAADGVRRPLYGAFDSAQGRCLVRSQLYTIGQIGQRIDQHPRIGPCPEQPLPSDERKRLRRIRDGVSCPQVNGARQRRGPLGNDDTIREGNFRYPRLSKLNAEAATFQRALELAQRPAYRLFARNGVGRIRDDRDPTADNCSRDRAPAGNEGGSGLLQKIATALTHRNLTRIQFVLIRGIRGKKKSATDSTKFHEK